MSNVVIRDFCDADLESAGNITFRIWSNEVAGIPPAIRPALYRYLAHYYYAPNSPFNLAAERMGKLCGFLMAAMPGTPRMEAFPALNDETRPYFEAYRRYLDGNRLAEEKALQENEIQLLLFTSTLRGTGKLLFAEFERRVRANNIASILLWTDETCDFDYYFHNGFTEVDHFPSPCCPTGKPFETWLFRKSL